MKTYLNSTEILDGTLLLLADSTSSLRTRLLSYMNDVMQSLSNERDWLFLQRTKTITIANDIVKFPSDYERMTLLVGDSFTCTRNDVISEDQLNTAYSAPKLIMTTTGLQIIPSTTGTVELTYMQNIPTYLEGEDTLFPVQTISYLKRAILTMFYEYDTDDRWKTSVQQLIIQMTALKRWDNSLAPLPQYESRGLLR